MKRTLIVACASSENSELKYILEEIFTRRLGLDWRLDFVNSECFEIRLKDCDRVLKLPNRFFLDLEGDGGGGVPSVPLAEYRVPQGLLNSLTSPVVPIIYGDTESNFVQQYTQGRSNCLPIDIFGSAFFMLGCFEEFVVKEQDSHLRFPCSKSLAYRAGFIDRPIVDEYIEILWYHLKSMWPDLQRKSYKARVRVSSDIDFLTRLDSGLLTATRILAADLIKRRQFFIGVRDFKDRIAAALFPRKYDHCYKGAEWLVEQSLEYGFDLDFYFMAFRGSPYDGNYDLSDSLFDDLLAKLQSTNVSAHLHPSYESYNDEQQIKIELSRLKDKLERFGWEGSDAIGSRQHYLRWDMGCTPYYLESAGIAHDSTLGYADIAGFRCGTAHPFYLYDYINRRTTNVLEKPLIVMDGTLYKKDYMTFSGADEMLQYILKLKRNALKFDGEFSLLWHNSNLNKPERKKMFLDVIQS